MEDTVNFDGDNYIQTSNVVCWATPGLEKVSRKARKTMGAGSIVAVVDVHEERFSKFKGKTRTHRHDTFKLGDAGKISERIPIRESYGRGILYFPKEDITILRGVRTFTLDEFKNERSFISYGLEEGKYITRREELKDMLKEAKEEHGAITIVHQRDVSGYLINNPDAWEFVDGLIVHSGSAKSQKLNDDMQEFYETVASKHGVGPVVVSGGHSYLEIGSSWMKIDKPDYSDADSFVESLRAGIRKPRYPEEERRRKNTLMPASHAAKLFAWGPISKRRPKDENGIAQ